MSRILLVSAVLIVLSLNRDPTLAFVQSSDEEAIKAVIRAETTTFYARDATGWQATWLHDSKASRTLIANTAYTALTGWEKIAAEMLKFFKADPTPSSTQFTNDNVVVQTDGTIAFVQYDQTTTSTMDPTRKQPSREYRVLVKRDDRWRIVSQITINSESFRATPESIENNLNATGYQLLELGKANEAIEVFKVNVQLYPKSWNTYDSLGEAYAAAGNKPLAIHNYEKSLELNPKNESGKAALAKLKR